MTDKVLESIRHSDEYKELVTTRARITWPLSILMLATYCAYIFVIAFWPGFFGTPVGDGPTTWGIVFGLGIILFSCVLTGIYVYVANTKLDKLTEKLMKKAGDL